MTYRELFLKTAPNPNVDLGLTMLNDMQRKFYLNLGAMGLAGESGEVADLLKKVLFHDRPLDREKLILELGDVRWYMECLCYVIGTTMEEVERMNFEKLSKRYPDGYSHEASAARKDLK